jgi:2-polyprenyl-3-methyl-5-hydroxy-6-metoxy-1,4-benzoquinol methylase
MPDPASAYINACPVGCTAPLLETNINLPEGPLRRCTGCGQLVSYASAARYRETMTQFDQTDFNQPTGRELERRNQVAFRRLRRITAILGKPPHSIRLVDVGCSRGQFVAAATALGFNAEGVEPAPKIAGAAQAAGLKVHQGLLEELRFGDSTFDALTLFEVVEHLRQPLELLRECRRVLSANGVLVISTGNTASWTVAAMRERWDYFDMAQDGGHISFFNPASLRQLAANSGFEIVRIETARVKFHDKAATSRLRYVSGKLLAELLNAPARLLGRGHDMVAYLRRPM